jgi:hypothetical protein
MSGYLDCKVNRDRADNAIVYTFLCKQIRHKYVVNSAMLRYFVFSYLQSFVMFDVSTILKIPHSA